MRFCSEWNWYYSRNCILNTKGLTKFLIQYVWHVSVIPEGLSQCHCPNGWVEMFFAMFVLLGIDSQFACFETGQSLIYLIYWLVNCGLIQ